MPREVPEKDNILLPNSHLLGSLSLARAFGADITLDIKLGNEATRALTKGQQGLFTNFQ